MLRRVIMFAVLLAVLLVPFSCGMAEVFFSQPPETWNEEDTLVWTIFDTNRSDAMMLSCGGENMMVDGGASAYRQKICEKLETLGLKHMRYILNTHYHDDHISGLTEMLRNGFTADEYLHPYSEEKAATNVYCRQAVKAAKNANVPIRHLRHGDTLTLGGAEIDVLIDEDSSFENGRSAVLKVKYKDASILLCADITGDVQKGFATDLGPEILDCDLLKFPHHGITPVTTEFLEAATPLAVVITNRQEETHPNSSGQMRARSISVMYSALGTVYAVTDGTDWYIYQTLREF